MSSSSNVARNAAWLMAATMLNKMLAFGAFALVARLTDPHIVGTYFYGVSVTSIFVVFSDLGMTPVIIRAIAAAREESERLLSAAIRLKVLLAPIAILMALGYAFSRHLDAVTMWTVAVACLVMTADTFHLLLYGVLRGRQRLQPEAIGMLIGQVLTVCASIFAAVMQLGPVGLASALLLGSLWNVLWAVVKTGQLSLAYPMPTRADFKRLAHEALPFGISGIAVKLYSYIDSLLLREFHGASAVGLYSVAYKMTYALQFVPLTFTAALYPALASAWAKKDHEQVRRTFVGSLRLMATVGFPLSAALSALAPRIIPFVYGREFLAAVPAFEILPWVLLPIFMDFPVGSLLNGSHRAHIKTTAMVATMVINAVLNVVLVPSLGPVGAAWAGVFSFWALYLIGLWFTAKDAGGMFVQIRILAQASFAAGVSWYAWRVLAAHMPLIAAGLFGGAIALIMAFIVRLITKEDVRLILRFRKPTAPTEEVHEEG